MTAELIIADAVRKSTETIMPGDPATAEAAVRYAIGTFAGGASVTEACEGARQMVMCRSRHPSVTGAGGGRMAAAS